MQSPPDRVTLPLEDRKRVNIPANAAYFTFIYPLTPKVSKDGSLREHTGSEDELATELTRARTAGSRAEKVDRFLNEPGPTEADDEAKRCRDAEVGEVV